MFVVFVAHLARTADVEAGPLAPMLGMSEYDVRLALSAPMPAIVQFTSDRDHAAAMAAALRTRGHDGSVFDESAFVRSDEMRGFGDFYLNADGVRSQDELLPFDDVFAILRAVHESSTGGEGAVDHLGRARGLATTLATRFGIAPPSASQNKIVKREQVAYFFRRSGERPWILREQHTSYAALGERRSLVTFTNFLETIETVGGACRMAVSDHRLVRRRVAERVVANADVRSSREGVDLLAHLLATSIAARSGSPYR